jgi:hypothetical protein
MKSQSETVLKSELADREEDIHRLKAEMCVLHEKLSQNSSLVRLLLDENIYLCPQCLALRNNKYYEAANIFSLSSQSYNHRRQP